MRKISSLLLALLLLPMEAQAQDYPSRPITVIVPFAAGGPSDVVARIVVGHMAKTLGQPMVVENIGGAGGAIGSARVAAAEPNGYNLLAGSMGSFVSAPVLLHGIKYDPVRDFAPIGLTADAPVVIVAKNDFPAKDLRDMVGYLKKNDAVREAHGGIGSSSHMACLLFTSDIGARPTLVPYRGISLAISDLLGGHVDFYCEQAVSIAEQIKSGTLKAYAVSGPERLAVLPDVPTAREFGIDFQMSVWAGMFAPKGTPKAVIDRLAAALDKAQDDLAVQKRLGELGGTVPAKAQRNPGNFAAFVKSEIARWTPILKTADTAAH